MSTTITNLLINEYHFPDEDWGHPPFYEDKCLFSQLQINTHNSLRPLCFLITGHNKTVCIFVVVCVGVRSCHIVKAMFGHFT